MFIAALLTIAKTLKQSKCPLRDEPVKMFYIYTHTHIHTHTHIYIYTFMYILLWAFLVSQTVKNLPAMEDRQLQSLGWEDLLGKGMATHPRYKHM